MFVVALLVALDDDRAGADGAAAAATADVEGIGVCCVWV